MPIVNSAKKDFLDGNIDLVNDTIKVALLTSTHITDIDTQDFWSDVSANEITGTGYTAGGKNLASKTVTQDDTLNKGVFDAANTVWTTSTITARFFVVYKDTGTATTSQIISITDFGSDQTSSSSDFTIQWNALGILNLA